MSVSILTVTQWARHRNLTLLNDMIRDQTYTDIAEWIIVEGSPTEAAARHNANKVSKITNPKCRIRYIAWTYGQPLGALRQAANDAAIADIRIVMDDDDYYPPTRVSHAVACLLASEHRLAGCSSMLMYDYGARALYQFRELGPNHSTSSCMAWKRTYDGIYDRDERVSDEYWFTQGFTQPMVQLDPCHAIVQSSHGTNTFSKKGLIETYVGKTIDGLDDDDVTTYRPAHDFAALVDRLQGHRPSISL